jgi:hypothetical protein
VRWWLGEGKGGLTLGVHAIEKEKGERGCAG